MGETEWRGSSTRDLCRCRLRRGTCNSVDETNGMAAKEKKERKCVPWSIQLGGRRREPIYKCLLFPSFLVCPAFLRACVLAFGRSGCSHGRSAGRRRQKAHAARSIAPRWGWEREAAWNFGFDNCGLDAESTRCGHGRRREGDWVAHALGTWRRVEGALHVLVWVPRLGCGKASGIGAAWGVVGVCLCVWEYHGFCVRAGF